MHVGIDRRKRTEGAAASDVVEIDRQAEVRVIERSLPVTVFFTSCWVIVDPPWAVARWRRSATKARMVPRTSTPPCE